MPADHHHHRKPLVTSLADVAVPSSGHKLRLPARSRARRSCVAIALCALGSLAIAGPAAAAGQATVTATVNHLFSNPEHFFGCPGEPGVTEYATGTERVQSVELASGTLNVSLGRTLRIIEVSDDPTVPPRERQVTDAQTFHLINNGPQVIFHDSFHDMNTGFGDTFSFSTYVVAADGEVRVDHSFERNPFPGC
jgi:hypothetical protein